MSGWERVKLLVSALAKQSFRARDTVLLKIYFIVLYVIIFVFIARTVATSKPPEETATAEFNPLRYVLNGAGRSMFELPEDFELRPLTGVLFGIDPHQLLNS